MPDLYDQETDAGLEERYPLGYIGPGTTPWEECVAEAKRIYGRRPKVVVGIPPHAEIGPVRIFDPLENAKAAGEIYRSLIGAPEMRRHGIVQHIGVTSDTPFDADRDHVAFLAREERSTPPASGEVRITQWKTTSVSPEAAEAQLRVYADLLGLPPPGERSAALETFSAPRVDLTVPGSPYALRRIREAWDGVGEDVEAVFPPVSTIPIQLRVPTGRAVAQIESLKAEMEKLNRTGIPYRERRPSPRMQRVIDAAAAADRANAPYNYAQRGGIDLLSPANVVYVNPNRKEER